jgi:hypothetical protein
MELTVPLIIIRLLRRNSLLECCIPNYCLARALIASLFCRFEKKLFGLCEQPVSEPVCECGEPAVLLVGVQETVAGQPDSPSLRPGQTPGRE